MRALHRPGRDDHLLAGAYEAPLGALDVLHAHGAPVVDADAVGARAGTHRQRFTTACGIEVGLAAAMAQAPPGVGLQDADALVLRAVVVGRRRDAGLYAGAVECRAQLIGLKLDDVDRPICAAQRRIAADVGLAALEKGQHVVVAPAGAAGIAPRIVFCRLPAHP